MNADGELGNGTSTNQLKPMAVTDVLGALQLSANIYDTCALLNDNSMKCWGNNAQGKLDDGTTTRRYTPVVVQDISDAVAIAAGGHTPAHSSATAGPSAGDSMAKASSATVRLRTGWHRSPCRACPAPCKSWRAGIIVLVTRRFRWWRGVGFGTRDT